MCPLLSGTRELLRIWHITATSTSTNCIFRRGSNGTPQSKRVQAAHPGTALRPGARGRACPGDQRARPAAAAAAPGARLAARRPPSAPRLPLRMQPRRRSLAATPEGCRPRTRPTAPARAARSVTDDAAVSYPAPTCVRSTRDGAVRPCTTVTASAHAGRLSAAVNGRSARCTVHVHVRHGLA